MNQTTHRHSSSTMRVLQDKIFQHYFLLSIPLCVETDSDQRMCRQNHDRRLWSLGSLPPGLITFYNRTVALDRSWHVLGLGYDPDVKHGDIERAAVIHYNGNKKPWLEISMPRYRNYWSRYVDYDQVYLRDCNLSP